MGRVTRLSKRVNVEQTPAQERLWDVLQEEKNRHLSIQKLCLMAGYRSDSPWYWAMKDPEFRTRVEDLGIATRRYASQTEVLIPLAVNADEVWSKDTIDLRQLVADYPKHMNKGSFQLDFTCISNPRMRVLVKRYFRARLGFWEPATFKENLKSMKPFFWALGERIPEMEAFTFLTRPMIEPLLTCSTWTDQRGNIIPLARTKNV